MAISMFSSQASPIAIDFGTSSVKMLQLTSGEAPGIVAACELELPEAARTDQGKRQDFLNEEVPKALRKGKFRGKKAACTIPAAQTFVQHMQVPTTGPSTGEDYVKNQLQIQTGYSPANVVMRTVEVTDVSREGGVRKETICFAVPREVVMRQIELLNRCRLEVSGLHTEQHALTWAFKHIHKREGDENITNLFVDFGWGSTKVGISHGTQLVFSKSIPIGGRHFDQTIADSLHCDLPSARAHRLASMECFMPRTAAATSRATGSAILDTGLSLADQAQGAAAAAGSTALTATNRRGSGGLPASLLETGQASGRFSPAGVDFSELLGSMIDELAMCLRYHRSLFENRPIHRIIFLGGESRQAELCRLIAGRLNIPAQLGDPMARLKGDSGSLPPGVKPGWAVAFGLCTSEG